MDLIDGIVYINLDHRLDRRAEIEGELRRLGALEKAIRFPAVFLDASGYGCVGCGLSHIEVLKYAKEQGWKNVLILEDDFQACVDPASFWKTITTFFSFAKDDWDVLMLSYSPYELEPVTPDFVRVQKAGTTAGYLVHKRMYDTLREFFEWSIARLIATKNMPLYSIDASWFQIQPDYLWYATKNPLGIQRPSYSDISYGFVDYSKV